MTKDMNLWAVKLNNSVVEIRATAGPAKVIRSSLTKPKAIKVESWDYTSYPPKEVIKYKAMILRQTTMVGGRIVGKLSYHQAVTILGIHFPPNDGVVKLTPSLKAAVLSPAWRKLYL